MRGRLPYGIAGMQMTLIMTAAPADLRRTP